MSSLSSSEQLVCERAQHCNIHPLTVFAAKLTFHCLFFSTSLSSTGQASSLFMVSLVPKCCAASSMLPVQCIFTIHVHIVLFIAHFLEVMFGILWSFHSIWEMWFILFLMGCEHGYGKTEGNECFISWFTSNFY